MFKLAEEMLEESRVIEQVTCWPPIFPDWRVARAERGMLKRELAQIYLRAREVRETYRALRKLIPPQRAFRDAARPLRERIAALKTRADAF